MNTITDHYDGPFTRFDTNTVALGGGLGTVTVLRWSGAKAPPATIIHLGLEVRGDSAVIRGFFWRKDSTGTGWPLQVGGYKTKQGIRVYNDLDLTSAKTTSGPFYIGNARVEFYNAPVPLAELNDHSQRTPTSVISIPTNPSTPHDHDTLTLSYPRPPAGTKTAVFVFDVDTSPFGEKSPIACGGRVRDFVQVRVEKPLPSLTPYGLVSLILLLAGTALWVVRKRRAELAR